MFAGPVFRKQASPTAIEPPDQATFRVALDVLAEENVTLLTDDDTPFPATARFESAALTVTPVGATRAVTGNVMAKEPSAVAAFVQTPTPQFELAPVAISAGRYLLQLYKSRW